jgi:hypothetical protein
MHIFFMKIIDGLIETCCLGYKIVLKSRIVYKLHTFFFTFVWPCIITNFFITKPTRCTNLRNLSWHETLHASDSSSVHHQEYTVHSVMAYVIQVCRQLSSRTQTCMTYAIAECTVKQLLIMDRGTVWNM